jgi:hypothetical protein
MIIPNVSCAKVEKAESLVNQQVFTKHSPHGPTDQMQDPTQNSSNKWCPLCKKTAFTPDVLPSAIFFKKFEGC